MNENQYVKVPKFYIAIQWKEDNVKNIEKFIEEYTDPNYSRDDNPVMIGPNDKLSLDFDHTNNDKLVLDKGDWLLVKKVKKRNGTGWNAKEKYLVKMTDSEFHNKFVKLWQ